MSRLHRWLNRNIEREHTFLCVCLMVAIPFAIVLVAIEAAIGHYLPVWLVVLAAMACIPFMFVLMPPAAGED